MRPKTVKSLEENMKEELHDTGLCNDFSDMHKHQRQNEISRTTQN